MGMASTQKFIARNRAPRVRIDYSVEIFGAEKTVDLPFVIGVLADLAGQPRQAPPSLEQKKMREIDVDNFETHMQRLQPRVAFAIPDATRGTGELAVDLTFETMEDFLPGAIARRVPGVDRLLEQRTQLANLVVYLDGKTAAESLIENVLSDSRLQQQARSSPVEPEAQSFLDLLSQTFKPRTQEALAQVGAAVTTLVEQVAGGHEAPRDDAIQVINSVIARLDGQLATQIDLILHHPDFQRLEGAWRGLLYLVRNTETSESLKIAFMSLSKTELRKVIVRYQSIAWDQNPLFKILYEEVYGQLGGQPYGCLIGDYEFTHEPADIEILRGIAQIAAAAHAPFLSGASPRVMDMKSWQEISMPRDTSQLFASPSYSLWRSFRETEESRYIALTLPRFLARVPYGQATDPVEEFSYEEQIQGTDPRSYVWANAAYAFGTNIARAFTLYGWCARVRGIESGGLVEGLPVHLFLSDDGTPALATTEVAISDRREAELSKLGFTPLVWRRNTDSGVFISAHTLHQPAVYDDPELTAADQLAARLPYILTSCRFVHYIKCIMRDSVGSFMDREQMERWLNDWIAQYVEHDPANSNEEGRSRRPLADAQVVLEPIADNSASYMGKLYIRPHYQLEGLTTSLRILFRMPSQRPT
jgi:type VI secretion system protein ImpC